MTAVATPPTTGERATLLNQVIAVRNGVRNDTQRHKTELYHLVQRSGLFDGQVRTYQPRDDEGFVYPSESVEVQAKCEQVMTSFANWMARLFDVTAAMDYTNQHARADIVVFGQGEPITLLRDVPASYLIFLEKQLVDVETFLRNLPTLDPATVWDYDSNAQVFRSEPKATVKTAKVRRNHVKAPATDKHPAQVEVFTEDEPIGTWSTAKLSGAMSNKRVAELLDRVTALSHAVKFARETANLTAVMDARPGKRVFEYLFA